MGTIDNSKTFDSDYKPSKAKHKEMDTIDNSTTFESDDTPSKAKHKEMGTIDNLTTFESDYTPLKAELKVGQFLGENKNYRLEKNLGVGGMGEIWLATEIRNKQEIRKVVVKTLRPDRRENEGAQEKALKQFQRIHTLNHQNICPIYVIERDSACGYLIVMGYAEGSSYSDWFNNQTKENGGIPIKTVCEVLHPIAEALDHAHKVGIIHRDVKPENMMFTQINGVQTSWLIDFGIAANLRTASKATTGQFSKSGTDSYMAPEQKEGKRQTAQTDEYSLAVVALKFLTGSTFIQAAISLPPTIQTILLKAVEIEPSKRYTTCREFIDALTSAGAKLPESSNQAVEKPQSELDPIYADLRQKEEAKRRAAEEARQKKIHKLESAISKEYQSERFVEAISHVKELQQLQPENQNLQFLLKSCEEKLAIQEAERKAREEEARQKKIQELEAAISEEYQSERYAEAILHIKELQQIQPENQKLQVLLKHYEEKLAIQEEERKKRFITVPTDCSLEEACEKAVEGALITIMPGKYELSQTIDLAKNITLQGEMETSQEVVIDCPTSPAFKISGGSPSFQNLTISGGGVWEYCVDVYSGTPKFFRCTITSKGSGMYVSGIKTDPEVESCVIKDCAETGLSVDGYGLGTFKDCEIYGNANMGIEVMSSGNPTVTRCKIHDCDEGVSVSYDGLGTFTDCEIYGNASAGIFVNGFGDPTVIRCKIHEIHDCNRPAVRIVEHGLGTFTDCEIYGSASPGIVVAKSGNPTVTGCKIRDGKSVGVAIFEQGLGKFNNCEIYGNELSGIYVLTSGNPTVTGCNIHDGKEQGVSVSENGRGTFNDCKIYGNEHSGILVETFGNPIVTGCKIHDGKTTGVFVYENGLGEFNDCEIYGNALSGIEVRESGNPTVTGCKIHDGKCYGVYVHNKGEGTFNNNTLAENYWQGKLNNWVIENDAGDVKGSGNTPEIPLANLSQENVSYANEIRNQLVEESNANENTEHMPLQAQHYAGERKVYTLDGIEYPFRWCPPGEFMMGGNSWITDSKPIHKVKITKGFWLLETQVTQAMWQSVMGENPSEFKGDRNPVENVSWDDSQEFCKKLSVKLGQTVKLPTEAQWEYACRAGASDDYAVILAEIAWYNKNSDCTTHIVGQKKPNRWGLYDMYGNVWEFCSDYYDADYYDWSPTNDPENTTASSSRVSRGGCWGNSPRDCNSASRCQNFPSDRFHAQGLRVLLVPGQE